MAQKTVPPLPSADQLAWSDMEIYLFIHFGPNTFSGKEWGSGNELASSFNPSALDCRQWCRIAKAAGAKGIIITAKHHDGFCLWPSAYSTHTVAYSPWENGRGDVLKNLSEACKEYGLKMGVYLSPWDRNHPAYGTVAYNSIFENMMREVVKNYGPFFEFWWDGANGEGPDGKKQNYDWRTYEQTLRTIAPHTIIFSDIGPDARWAGNEKGYAGETNWNLLDTAGFKRGEGAPPQDTLQQGNVFGKNWIPAECDVSIRPGWFYHTAEDSLVKSPQTLFELYMKSVGRGANLLLNVPPDTRGLINEKDSASLMGFKKLRDENFRHNLLQDALFSFNQNGIQYKNSLLADDDESTFIKTGIGEKGGVTFQFKQPIMLNCIELQEPIAFGQRVMTFSLMLHLKDHTIIEIKGTTIGHKRLISFPRQEITSFDLVIHSSKNDPLISTVKAFLLND
ncbi:MAG: alpha-L-fucosidase [Bacteroidetes bacterium]|nr:alpha-L-fucosidase [Bacteroidota bacterium]